MRRDVVGGSDECVARNPKLHKQNTKQRQNKRANTPCCPSVWQGSITKSAKRLGHCRCGYIGVRSRSSNVSLGASSFLPLPLLHALPSFSMIRNFVLFFAFCFVLSNFVLVSGFLFLFLSLCFPLLPWHFIYAFWFAVSKRWLVAICLWQTLLANKSNASSDSSHRSSLPMGKNKGGGGGAGGGSGGGGAGGGGGGNVSNICVMQLTI